MTVKLAGIIFGLMLKKTLFIMVLKGSLILVGCKIKTKNNLKIYWPDYDHCNSKVEH